MTVYSRRLAARTGTFSQLLQGVETGWIAKTHKCSCNDEHAPAPGTEITPVPIQSHFHLHPSPQNFHPSPLVSAKICFHPYSISAVLTQCGLSRNEKYVINLGYTYIYVIRLLKGWQTQPKQYSATSNHNKSANR